MQSKIPHKFIYYMSLWNTVFQVCRSFWMLSFPWHHSKFIAPTYWQKDPAKAAGIQRHNSSRDLNPPNTCKMASENWWKGRVLGQLHVFSPIGLVHLMMSRVPQKDMSCKKRSYQTPSSNHPHKALFQYFLVCGAISVGMLDSKD